MKPGKRNHCTAQRSKTRTNVSKAEFTSLQRDGTSRCFLEKTEKDTQTASRDPKADPKNQTYFRFFFMSMPGPAWFFAQLDLKFHWLSNFMDGPRCPAAYPELGGLIPNAGHRPEPLLNHWAADIRADGRGYALHRRHATCKCDPQCNMVPQGKLSWSWFPKGNTK